MAKKSVVFDENGVIVSVFFSFDLMAGDDCPAFVDSEGGVVDVLEGTELFDIPSLNIHAGYRVNIGTKKIEPIPEESQK